VVEERAQRASRNQDLLAWDRAHLWHPYSSATSPLLVHEVTSASGVRLRLRRDGREVEVVDAMSSWWCAIHGYAVPELDAAVRDQVGAMSHVMFGGLTHEPAVELGRRLVELSGLPHVFLADSGSVSVEVAMKMAWQAQAGTGRTRFFTIRGGYHGDTFSPMSVCDPDGGMHSMYAGIVPEHVFAPLPPLDDPLAEDEETRDAAFLEWARVATDLFEQHAHEMAAVIVVPLVQGAAGKRPWSARCL
jgi:adenosylmethionine-8-amino-7-oxononanoate aminotransferase